MAKKFLYWFQVLLGLTAVAAVLPIRGWSSTSRAETDRYCRSLPPIPGRPETGSGSVPDADRNWRDAT